MYRLYKLADYDDTQEQYIAEVWDRINMPGRYVGRALLDKEPAVGMLILTEAVPEDFGFARIINVWRTGTHEVHSRRYTVLVTRK